MPFFCDPQTARQPQALADDSDASDKEAVGDR